jgi:hypothetical protein
VKVAARKIFLARRGANGNAIQFNSRARRVAGELQFFSVAARGARKQQYGGAH